MPIEPKLEEYPKTPPVKMGFGFFRSLRDRIETIAPVETDENSLIKVKYENDKGCIISARMKELTITVCSNGVPEDIKIIASAVNEENVEAFG